MAQEQPGSEALAAIRGCTRCALLVAARTQVVAGEGPVPARVVAVADAPGAEQDAAGRPVTGRAEALLAAAFGELAGQAYLTGLVKCRPPGGRDPTATETAACSDHLLTEVGLLRPRVVVALGERVAKVLRGRPTAIRAVRGTAEPCLLGGLAVWLLPVYSPAAALYEPVAAAQLRRDLALLPALLGRGRPAIEPAPPQAVDGIPLPVPEPGPGQLELF